MIFKSLSSLDYEHAKSPIQVGTVDDRHAGRPASKYLPSCGGAGWPARRPVHREV